MTAMKESHVGLMNNLLIYVLASAGGVAWAQTPVLSLSGGSGLPGGNVGVAVNFTPNGAPATGIQWTMNYSTSDFSSVTVVESATASAGGEVLSCQTGAGQVICLMADLTSSTVRVPSGQIAVATFQISPSTTGTSSTISLSALFASSGSGASLGLTGTGTTITITQNGGGGGLGFAGSMSHLASGGNWDTTLTLVNTGAAPGEALLKFFGDNGNPLQLPFTFPQAPAPSPLAASTLDRAINAHSLLVVETQQPGTNLPQVGSAQLLTGSNIGGFAIFKYTPTGQEAVVPLETRDSPSYVLAFDNTGVIATGVALANVGTQPANIPVVIRDDTGKEIGKETISLPAQGHTSFLLASKYAITMRTRGTVEFDTPPSGEISALGLRANAGALTTLPLIASATAGSGSMAQVASGGGWQTTFTLVNTGTSPAQVTLSFFDNSGNALSLPLTLVQTGQATTTTSFSQTIAAGATLAIVTHASTALVGSAQLTTGGNVSGFAIFRSPKGQEAVVPLETHNTSTYVLAFDNTNKLATGLALANVSSQAVAVPVVLRDDTGASLGKETIKLAASGHTSFILADSYASVAGKRGTVEFDTPAGAQISVLGLRATPAGAVTTIPVLAK
jgi:hypothetical protein